ncbi:hypothetical protein HOE425_330301 [Hoeflea sp. EC-HK425]|nr:hypothetical protein HOE425_330301 [Hoeflea sp. EC-HK425]
MRMGSVVGFEAENSGGPGVYLVLDAAPAAVENIDLVDRAVLRVLELDFEDLAVDLRFQFLENFRKLHYLALSYRGLDVFALTMVIVSACRCGRQRE